MRPILALCLLSVLLSSGASAQGRRPRGSGADSIGEVAESARQGSANRKEAIEAYLKGRMEKLEKVYTVQQDFGRRFGEAWESFWSKVFEERKLFEVRIARQRHNLFESLASLEPAAHAQAIADFDKLQNNLIKSFEDAQKARMAEFFAKANADFKQFAAEQEKQRAAFTTEALQSWQAQRKNPVLVPQ